LVAVSFIDQVLQHIQPQRIGLLVRWLLLLLLRIPKLGRIGFIHLRPHDGLAIHRSDDIGVMPTVAACNRQQSRQ
jgi:hypothetical protein